MRPIQALFYVENTLEHKQPGWVSIYLDPGQEWKLRNNHLFGHVNDRF